MPSLSPPFRALAEAFVPEILEAPPERWAAVERTVCEALRLRPAALRRQVDLLVRGLDVLALARHGHRLARLDPETRGRLLGRLADSRILLLRRGLWGLRTLVMMGWYTQPEVAAGLGYRATPAGWEAGR